MIGYLGENRFYGLHSPSLSAVYKNVYAEYIELWQKMVRFVGQFLPYQLSCPTTSLFQFSVCREISRLLNVLCPIRRVISILHKFPET